MKKSFYQAYGSSFSDHWILSEFSKPLISDFSAAGGLAALYFLAL